MCVYSDFRGLADCMGLKPMWTKDNDYVKGLIETWSAENLEKANLGTLCEFLKRIDRFDVLEDIRKRLGEYIFCCHLECVRFSSLI